MCVKIDFHRVEQVSKYVNPKTGIVNLFIKDGKGKELAVIDLFPSTMDINFNEALDSIGSME